ncbi:MAG: pyruvate, phosphate dikinase [Saprospiraceae bacterium]|nr:pyruvate, phosphate dikinase [Saprospiraceae bacterium]
MGKLKYVYTFGSGSAEGNATMKELLGGKGANLAEMCSIGLPVPPGFTITTEACTHYFTKGKDQVLQLVRDQVKEGIQFLEEITGRKYGDPVNPLLLSVRSGARVSMPGMMDTVLNLGLNDQIVGGLSIQPGRERMAWDSYRRLLHMYGDVVMGLKPHLPTDIDPFEEVMQKLKSEKKVLRDTDLNAKDLQELSNAYQQIILERLGKSVPKVPREQLDHAIVAVFDSWMGRRAIQYRKINQIPSDWGTAVNVQAMVFGNTGDSSATGVAFTRDPSTGEKDLTGEYLINAQGEDVVAGIRTPLQVTKKGSLQWAKLSGVQEDDRVKSYPSLEEVMPDLYQQLHSAQLKLEEHYEDMQDLEFTIEDQKLWILQTRSGKRTGQAMVRIAMEMLDEGLIDQNNAILRVEPKKLDELLHPVFDATELAKKSVLAKGLPASPGACTGQIVFFAEDAEEWAKDGKDVILVRIETSPEDIQGMHSARGILTSRGGITSHAAVVARGMGKCCVSGAGTLHVDYQKRQLMIGDIVMQEGSWISLDGSTGNIYDGKVQTKTASVGGHLGQLLQLCKSKARLAVRANADTPEDAKIARNFAADGIGLCRTEHMFFKEERITAVREMILAHSTEGRIKALDKLLPIQRTDFHDILSMMEGLPVTIRLLDPPLHEFLPQDEESERALANEMGITYEEVLSKVEALHEMNPMLGHRGCRLANTYPEISIMQTRAILEAALDLQKEGKTVYPEIMVPLAGISRELKMQVNIIRDTAEKVFAERGATIPYKIGTMIEIPRAALVADYFADFVDFFSFGTNDLTQMTFGYSRDDVGKFLPVYLSKGILKVDPFQTIDPYGVGELVEIGAARGKAKNPKLKVGVCGEHGGDPDSIHFFHKKGLDYVSCSSYRVPIAHLVAAQANIMSDQEDVPSAVKDELTMSIR